MKITKWMRFALIALSVVMALSLFACGDPEETTTAQKEETSENKTDATTESKGTEATDSEGTEPDKETTDGDVVTTEGDTDEVTTEGDVVTTEGTTESGSETTESGSETTDTESESETTETETESVETTEAPCEHVPVEDAAVKPTCTETGLTKGYHCEKCGEILVAQEVVPTRAHDPKNVWEYAANPEGDTAILVNPCADCGAAAETKAASFQLSVEGIFGGEAVYTFQASETVIPLMGTEMLQFNPDHPNYPATGYTPVPDGSATGFGNLFGIAGWAGYVGSTLEDGASYKIVDLEGNVLVEWTAVKGVLAEAGLNVTSAADPAITEFLAANYTDGATAGFRFYHIVNVSEHINEIAGKTVNVTFAFNATAAAEGATYIPYATLQLSVPECAHINCTVYEAKDPACDEAGNDYYKVCALCQKILGEDGTVLEAAPIIPATGHTLTDVAEVAATCTEAGNVAHKNCSVCGKNYDAEGKEIEDVVVPALGHNPVEKAFTAPTTAEAGWEAHKYCEACGTAWSTEGEALDAVPTLPVIVPESEVYLGVVELGGKIVNGGKVTLEDGSEAPSKFNVPAISTDRTYVRFERGGWSDDGNIMLIDNEAKAVTGNYMIIKYRTDNQETVQIWANTLSYGHESGTANYYTNLTADGEWHILVIDLSKDLGAFVQADEEGNYAIQWARIDLLDGKKQEGYVDIAYVVFCDDPTDALFALQDGDENICTHIASPDATYENKGDYHTTKCLVCDYDIEYSHNASAAEWNAEQGAYVGGCVCGAEVKSYFRYQTEAFVDGGAARMTVTRGTDDDGTTYVRYAHVESTSDPYAIAFKGGVVGSGKYMLIRYRAVGTTATMTLNPCFGASIASGKTSANNGDQGMGNLGTLIADGEWHYFVVDITKNGTKDIYADDDGNIDLNFLRISFPHQVLEDGSYNYIDIDYFAFATEGAALENYVYADLAPEYAVNFDASNCSFNGVRGDLIAASARTDNAPIVIDMAGKTLNSADAVAVGGWCVVRGGVSSYKFRVVSVDGVAVEDAALVDFFVGSTTNADNGITKVGTGKGWSADCGKGAAFQSPKAINLAGYEGKTINVEVVAISAIGQHEIVISQINNIAVPAAQ